MDHSLIHETESGFGAMDHWMVSFFLEQRYVWRDGSMDRGVIAWFLKQSYVWKDGAMDRWINGSKQFLCREGANVPLDHSLILGAMDQWIFVNFLGQGSEGGISGALQRIFGALKMCYDMGMERQWGSKRSLDHSVFFFYEKFGLDHWIIGTLEQIGITST